MTNVRSLGTIIVALLFSTGLTGCDVEDRGDDEQRSCNASDDPECAAELAQAIEVVRSMGIDPDEESVDVWLTEDDVDEAELLADYEAVLESRDDAAAAQPTAGSTAPDSLSAPTLDHVEALNGFSCSSNDYGGCTCCCYWGYGGQWGCGCTVACGD